MFTNGLFAGNKFKKKKKIFTLLVHVAEAFRVPPMINKSIASNYWMEIASSYPFRWRANADPKFS